MAQFLTPALLQMNDSSANPLVGAKLYIYETGTTTLLNLYSNEALSAAIANPIVADAAGVFASAFMAQTKFKAVLKTSADVTLYTRDPVYSVGQADNIQAEDVQFDGTGIGFSSTDVQAALVEMFNSTAQKTGGAFTGPISVPTSLTLTVGDDGATSSPSFNLIRFSATPAANDYLGGVEFFGSDSDGNQQHYSSIAGYIISATGGAEAGGLLIGTEYAGVWAARVQVERGLFMAGATGGDPGAGKINATGYQTNGVAMPFTKAFESAQQTITAAGALTIAHGLGTTPKLYLAVLQCTTDNIGYVVGDEVLINPSVNSDGGGTRGISLVPDATNINVRFATEATSISLVRKDTGAFGNITNASWRLVVRAWA